MSKNENLKPFAIDAGKASVAIAVASLCAASAQATTVGNVGVGKLSLEKAVIGFGGSSTSTSSIGTILATLGAVYSANDVLVLTLDSNASFSTATPTLTCGGSSTGWDIFDKGAQFVKFRVPATFGSTTTFASGVTCTLAGATLLDQTLDVANETVKITASGVAANSLAFDSTGTATTVSTVINSLAMSVAAANALSLKVDPAALNKKFKGGLTSDNLTFSFTSTAVDNPISLAAGLTTSATAAATIDISGDFNFLVNGSETSATVLGGTNSATATAAGGASGVNLTALYTGSSVTGLRLSVEAAQLSSGLSIRLMTDGSTNSNALTPQTFTGSYTIRGTSNSVTGTAKTGTLTPGSWGQGGTTVFVPYMPVGSGITQVLYIANNSSTAGSTTITATGQAGHTCTTSAVTTLANANTNLSDALASAIATCQAAGTVATTDKLMLTIVSTTPVTYTEVYSSFTVSGSSRVTIPNSSNGYKGNAAANLIGTSNADNSP